MYISLKEGWTPLADLCEKYSKDKGNMNKVLSKMDPEDKEKIGKTWIVKEAKFVELIKTDIVYEKTEREEVTEMIEDLTTKLSEVLTADDVKSRFVLHFLNNAGSADKEYLIQVFMEWCIKAQIVFPHKLFYEHMNNPEDEFFVRYTLIISLWNKTLSKHEKVNRKSISKRSQK